MVKHQGLDSINSAAGSIDRRMAFTIIDGIGELGRPGLIITPTHGPRVRLAVVTTDLPLMHDAPVSIGVQHFCAICKKCSDN